MYRCKGITDELSYICFMLLLGYIKCNTSQCQLDKLQHTLHNHHHLQMNIHITEEIAMSTQAIKINN